MPFVKKTDSSSALPMITAQKVFIGRQNELDFFVQHILQSEEPAFNIISIAGNGGVGKSTLLAQFIAVTYSSNFKEYCLSALVDERQTTPASIMEKFAEQLRLKGEFEQVLKQYKDILHNLHTERETGKTTVLHHTPDFAGALVEGVPIVGPLLREGAKATTAYFLDKYNSNLTPREIARSDDPVFNLTKTFVADLNYLASTKVKLSYNGEKRERRIILFFDTFEQLAAGVVPWMLDYLLESNINNNVVLVVAGREPIERSNLDYLKHWLKYYEAGTICSFSLNSFTEDETRAFLTARGISDPNRVDTIWRLSLGLPLYLSLLASNPQGEIDPTKDVVSNFLRWIPEEDRVKRRLALDAALLSRPFNLDDLEVFNYLPNDEDERVTFYHWLVKQPFVRGNAENGRYRYHDLVREIFSRHLYQRSQKEYYATRRTLINHYQQLLNETQLKENKFSSEWLELSLALAQQLFLLPDDTSHVDAIEQILNAYENTVQFIEILRILRELAREQPDALVRFESCQIAKELIQIIEADVASMQGEILASPSYRVRSSMRELLPYIEVDMASQYRALQVATNHLLAKVAQKSSFSPKLLASLYFKRANSYASFEKYEQAIADYESTLKLQPDYVRAYGFMGRVYRFRKEPQRALENFERALALDPNYGFAYGERAIIYRDFTKEYDKAIEGFKHAVSLNPQLFWAHNGLGKLYLKFKNYQLALQEFNISINLRPDHGRAYAYRGTTYCQLKDYNRALQDLNLSIELNPKYPRVYAFRSETYCRLKAYDRALQDLNLALELNPKFVWAYALRGLTYLYLKDILRAETDYARSWEMDPTSANLNAGWMAEWSRMCHERISIAMLKRLEVIVAVDPQIYTAYICRGVILWQRGSYLEALKELERARLLEPEEWDAYFWKGMTCASLERDEEAIASLEKALELEIPPVLLAPLQRFEQDRPELYKRYVIRE